MATPREIFGAFYSQVVWQYHEFNEFLKLYYGSEKLVRLLNLTAKDFFSELFYILIDRIILNISKLTDPPATYHNANLSILRLHQDVGSEVEYLSQEAQPIVDEIRSISDEIKQWRNKLVGHIDLKVALRELKIHEEFVPAKVVRFYELVQEYLSVVGNLVFHEPFPIDSSSGYGVDDLITRLTLSQIYLEQIEDNHELVHTIIDKSQWNDI